MASDDVSHETMHVSLLCSIQSGNPHNPCSGTCDGHGAGKPCDLPCQCACHQVPRETITDRGFDLWYRSIARFHGPDSGGQGFDISDLADAFTAGDAFGRGPVVPRETVQARAAAYRQAAEGLGQLVRDMKAEGIGPSEIARQTGKSRTTIGRLLGARWPYDHGKFQQSVPRETKPDDGST